jgi:formylglycine-generating enzyme required for sulfatase activity
MATAGEARWRYTLTVEWEEVQVRSFETPFRQHLGKCAQLLLVANEQERKRTLGEWDEQVPDSIDRDTAVEMGELSGWDFMVELKSYRSWTSGETFFAAKVFDLRFGRVKDVSMALPPEGEAVAAERLAHEVCRLLPPRVSVNRWKSRRYNTVILDAGSTSGIENGQKLNKMSGAAVTARLKVTQVRPAESEAEVEFGQVEEGDTLVVVVPAIPPSQACVLRVSASISAGEYSVWIDGIPQGESSGGYAEVQVWPGTHHVKLTGQVEHEERVTVGRSGYTLTVNASTGLRVDSAVSGIVFVRRPGSSSWRQLGQTGLEHELSSGAYEVRVVADGYLSWTGSVSVHGSASSLLRAELRSAAGMVRIPGGRVRLEQPSVPGEIQRDVTLSEFRIDAREVTVAEFSSYSPSYEPPVDFPGTAPATFVSWQKAHNYCESKGKRLPTEAEWERACRGPSGSRFGYGESFDSRFSDARTDTNAGSYPTSGLPASGYGLYGMTGGVWEWCGQDNPSGNERSLKGGAWRMLNPEQRADCASRLIMSVDTNAAKKPFGFRCAADSD